MIAIKFLLFFIFVTFGSGGAEPNKKLPDPLGTIRETCRERANLTKDQLKCAEYDLEALGKFMVCAGEFVGDHTPDGTIRQNVTNKAVGSIIGMETIVPVVAHCVDQVYHGQKPPVHEIPRFYAEFIVCVKHGLPTSKFNRIGLFAAPVRSNLDICQKW